MVHRPLLSNCTPIDSAPRHPTHLRISNARESAPFEHSSRTAPLHARRERQQRPLRKANTVRAPSELASEPASTCLIASCREQHHAAGWRGDTRVQGATSRCCRRRHATPAGRESTRPRANCDSPTAKRTTGPFARRVRERGGASQRTPPPTAAVANLPPAYAIHDDSAVYLDGLVAVAAAALLLAPRTRHLCVL